MISSSLITPAKSPLPCKGTVTGSGIRTRVSLGAVIQTTPLCGPSYEVPADTASMKARRTRKGKGPYWLLSLGRGHISKDRW